MNNPEKCGVAEVILAKQRNGPTGVVKLSWVSEFTRFYTYSPAEPPAEYREPKPAAARGASAFTPAAATGPVEDFRDGGGPDDDDVVGELFHLAEEMAGHEHRVARRRARSQQIPQGEDALWVQAVARLVEHEHGRVA